MSRSAKPSHLRNLTRAFAVHLHNRLNYRKVQTKIQTSDPTVLLRTRSKNQNQHTTKIRYLMSRLNYILPNTKYGKLILLIMLIACSVCTAFSALAVHFTEFVFFICPLLCFFMCNLFPHSPFSGYLRFGLKYDTTLFNPYMTNGLFHPYQLDEYISKFRDVSNICLF